MKKEMMAKLTAIIALLWITIWVLWTWLLAIFWDKYSDTPTEKTITKETLQKMIDEWKVKVNTQSWTNNKAISTEKNNLDEKLQDSALLESVTSSWTIENTWSTKTKNKSLEIKK